MAAFLLFPTVFKSSYRPTIGLAYTTDWNGKPVVTDRMHWTLAESVNTSATLATVTGKQVYKDWYAIFWKYIDEYLIDLVPPTKQGQQGHRHRLARQVRPVPCHAVHADPASRSGGFRRSGAESQSKRLAARNNRTSPFLLLFAKNPGHRKATGVLRISNLILNVCNSLIFSDAFTTI